MQIREDDETASFMCLARSFFVLFVHGYKGIIIALHLFFSCVEWIDLENYANLLTPSDRKKNFLSQIHLYFLSFQIAN